MFRETHSLFCALLRDTTVKSDSSAHATNYYDAMMMISSKALASRASALSRRRRSLWAMIAVGRDLRMKERVLSLVPPPALLGDMNR